jgi:hypothetical protein
VADGGAGALWDELAATAQDLGLRLQPSWTPRQTARELTAVLTRSGPPDGTAGTGADAVRRLALAEEAASYGPTRDIVGIEVEAHDSLVTALRIARRGLLRATPAAARLRALFWPASLVAGSASRLVMVRRLTAVGPFRRVGGTGTA